MEINFSSITTVVPQEIMEKISAKIGICMSTAAIKWNYSKPIPKIEYINRISRIAGRAKLVKRIIQLNVPFLLANTEKFIQRTVVHELAHIIAYDLFHDTGHGGGWKNVMWHFEAESSRCHSYRLDNLQKAVAQNANPSIGISSIDLDRSPDDE